jgi:hypothetical protein
MEGRDPFVETGPKEITVTRNPLARLRALSVLMLTLGFALPALADDPAPADDLASRFSGVFQVDFTNAYYFRGILQEKQGAILQPWAEGYFSLYSSDTGPIRSVSIGAGMWNSFHSERTAHDNTNQWWYEADLYPLITIGFAEGLTLNTVYYFYTSQNGAFTTVQELNFKLSWDDSEAFGKFSVKPWVNLAFETVNTSFGPDKGSGLQAGIAPTLWASESEAFPVTITAPAEIGLSLSDYYENAGGGENTFGYANVGVLASLPLKFMPESLGAWTLSAGGKYYAFSETLENANKGRSTYPVGTLSLGVAF